MSLEKPLFRLQRFLPHIDSTIGMWLIQDKFHCWTLEDEIRFKKVYGETAIPTGVYEIVLEVSPKFGLVPTIKNVKNFTAIRVHGGNDDDDTDGCPLVGHDLKSPNRIENCPPALKVIVDKLKSVGGKDYISIEMYVPPIPDEQ